MSPFGATAQLARKIRRRAVVDRSTVIKMNWWARRALAGHEVDQDELEERLQELVGDRISIREVEVIICNPDECGHVNQGPHYKSISVIARSR